MKYITLILAVLLFSGCSKSVKQKDAIQKLGIVTSVDNCHKHKSTKKCDVETDKYHIAGMMVSKFPDGDLFIGDTAFYKTELFTDKAEHLACKNNRCVSYAVCFWWMPCYEEEKSI